MNSDDSLELFHRLQELCYGDSIPLALAASRLMYVQDPRRLLGRLAVYYAREV